MKNKTFLFWTALEGETQTPGRLLSSAVGAVSHLLYLSAVVSWITSRPERFAEVNWDGAADRMVLLGLHKAGMCWIICFSDLLCLSAIFPAEGISFPKNNLSFFALN